MLLKYEKLVKKEANKKVVDKVMLKCMEVVCGLKKKIGDTVIKRVTQSSKMLS